MPSVSAGGCLGRRNSPPVSQPPRRGSRAAAPPERQRRFGGRALAAGVSCQSRSEPTQDWNPLGLSSQTGGRPKERAARQTAPRETGLPGSGGLTGAGPPPPRLTARPRPAETEGTAPRRNAASAGTSGARLRPPTPRPEPPGGRAPPGRTCVSHRGQRPGPGAGPPGAGRGGGQPGPAGPPTPGPRPLAPVGFAFTAAPPRPAGRPANQRRCRASGRLRANRRGPRARPPPAPHRWLPRPGRPWVLQAGRRGGGSGSRAGAARPAWWAVAVRTAPRRARPGPGREEGGAAPDGSGLGSDCLREASADNRRSAR